VAASRCTGIGRIGNSGSDVSWCHASAAGGIVPPGLVKGAQFQILISSGGGIAPETLEVIETEGTWIHAKIVQSQVWGQGDIWVNLAATDFGYVKVIGLPKPPQ